MIQGLDYFYDGQMRRFLEQIVRAFSGFQYKTGKRDGVEELHMVPCRMASTNKMVAAIMQNNSENTLLTVPMITVHQAGLSPRRDGLQFPGHVDTRHIAERVTDGNGNYTGERGNTFTIERIMPRPFTMNIQIDIWTSNLDQKHQLMEQILTVFFPSIDIQNSTNPLDWSALTSLSLDDINWSSRSMPVGSSDGEIEIATLTFNLPIWLNPPAKVTQQKRIHQIITNINEGESFTDSSQMTRVIVTPGNHHVRVEGNRITLLGANGAMSEGDEIIPWQPLVEQYGVLRPTFTQIRLYQSADFDGDDFVAGTVFYSGADPNKLVFQLDIDTLPTNTLSPIAAIIDPLRTFPGHGLNPTTGDRYIVLNDIGNSQAWGTISARVGDIIEWNGSVWTVPFVAGENEDAVHHVLNLHSGRQLRWTGEEWIVSIDGEYRPGFWRLLI